MAHTPLERSVRVVFDNNVLLQAMANAVGPAGACLEQVRQRRLRLCISEDLMAELREVASRPSVVAKLRLNESGTNTFIAELTSLAEMIQRVSSVFQHPIDPKDSMIINLAVAAGACVITSRDRHLLSLRDVNTLAGADFIARFPSIQLFTPAELLKRLRGAP